MFYHYLDINKKASSFSCLLQIVLDHYAKQSKRELEAIEFQTQIKEIYFDSKQRYGAPKIHKVLESQGTKTSVKRVQRHMTKL